VPAHPDAGEELDVEPRALTLIAAHGWDVLGVQAVGWNGIWVDRMEREWPFPGPAPARRAAGLAEAAALLG
jgi:FMN phosphatase YigB (HAD superfamily)